MQFHWPQDIFNALRSVLVENQAHRLLFKNYPIYPLYILLPFNFLIWFGRVFLEFKKKFSLFFPFSPLPLIHVLFNLSLVYFHAPNKMLLISWGKPVPDTKCLYDHLSCSWSWDYLIHDVRQQDLVSVIQTPGRKKPMTALGVLRSTVNVLTKGFIGGEYHTLWSTESFSG